MEQSANVQITDKGVDEVAHRKFKLSLKKRSVLIQLATPKTVQTLLQKSVFPEEEITEALQSLVQEGFIEISGPTETKPSYNISHTSAFRFVVNDQESGSDEAKPSNVDVVAAEENSPSKPKIVRVNSFRFVVKQ